MDQTSQTQSGNVPSSLFQNVRFDRFVEIRSPSLSAEWSVSDSQVIQKSQNYRKSLMETANKNEYLSIIKDVYTYYIQHDIKSAMERTESNFPAIDELFREALNNNDVEKVVCAYTLSGLFFRILNHHLAMIICVDSVEQMKMTKRVNMKYWEGPLDIATLFVCHPKLEQFRFKQGNVYRGMCVVEEDLIPYRTIGKRFLNKTFVSTSKNLEMAKIFSGIYDNTGSSKKCCLLRYTIVESSRRTALDINSLSNFPEEEEVLILPYATFEIINYKTSSWNEHLIEIELKECDPE